MNTRLQVEHPVTELVTGVDLVAWQIRLARGERLTVEPARALEPVGHAIECRIYAEDPDARFMPAPGRITDIRAPSGPGIRDDSGVAPGFEVPIFYDSMISKLAAWGESRGQALARMRRALAEYQIGGIRTTIPFFRWLLDTEDFTAARFDTTTLDAELASREGRPFLEPTRGRRSHGGARSRRRCLHPREPSGSRAWCSCRAQPVDEHSEARGHALRADMSSTFEIEIAGRVHTVSVERVDDGHRFRLKMDGVEHLIDAMEYGKGAWSIIAPGTGASTQAVIRPGDGADTLVEIGSVAVPLVVNGRRARRRADHGGPDGEQRILAPMPGKVLRVLVAPGDQVSARQPLVVVEAMKMENELSARRAGQVREVAVQPGASVEAGRLLIIVA